MNELVRRTNLLVSLGSFAGVDDVWKHNADAVTLDLRDATPEVLQGASRKWLRISTRFASFGGAEVFVAVNHSRMSGQFEGAVWPGIAGVLLCGVEDAAAVTGAAASLEQVESRRGIPAGSLQIIPVLETALGVWNVRQIVTAVPRVTQVALDEGSLSRNMGIQPQPDLDPFVYARGRAVVEAIAAGVQPIGAPHPLGTLQPDLNQDQLLNEGTRAKDLGFKGALIRNPDWVTPLNAAFSPAQEQVEFYTEVRRLFAEGVARGTAAVPLGTRMIDVPVDEWAKVVLALAAACRDRDEVKRHAQEGAG